MATPSSATEREAIEAACRDMWGKDYDDDQEQMYEWMRTAIQAYTNYLKANGCDRL